MSDTLSHVAEDRADADTAFRHWTFDTPGPVRIGSDEHRRMFCRMLLDTHHPYKPAVIDWPPLAPDAAEEARHILFFVNWVTWYRRNLPWWRRPWHALRVAAIWTALVRERLAIARGIDADGGMHDSNFLAANRGALNATLTPKALLDMCLEENERRMSGYDARLVHPSVMPAIARFALRFLKR